MTDTPETQALMDDHCGRDLSHFKAWCEVCELARKLERERNTLRKRVQSLEDELSEYCPIPSDK